MKKMPSAESSEVTRFLDALNHPLRAEIEQLRQVILNAVPGLSESIKWNGPNYAHEGEDRITMSIQPPRQIRLVFHRGAKKTDPPADRLIPDPSGLLDWKAGDRAVASFKNRKDIEDHEQVLAHLVRDWIQATARS
ncbi:MAG TPA: DUF1801 domain-containing protein [Chitinophagaceae bacterium]|nr:DUF1801 domain-containing protein [Chitinophagaceae bacterium]